MTTAVLSPERGKHAKLREDLRITPQETAEGVVYLINDPRSGRFCQFRQLEHFIAIQCNGNRSLDEIRQRVNGTALSHSNSKTDTPVRYVLDGQECPSYGSVSRETLHRFVEKLRHLDLLEPEHGQEPLKSGHNRVQGGLLHMRARLFDPDRLLARLVRPLAVVFTLEFLILSAGLLLAATVVAITRASEISSGLVRCARPELIVGLVVAMVTVTLLHELAHGLTCKRFGGEVHEIGFLSIYFLPAFYCNVSSAWGFTKKSHRLWVTFAGPWSTLLIWALAVFCWRLSLAGTWINTAALLVMAVTGVETFFNLNPLIKLDGYYLLSDALEIPNLRQRAFQYVGDRVKWLFGVAGKTERDLAARHRRIFMIYGTLAMAYSAALLVVVALKVGGFLMSHYQALGFIVFVILLAVVFRRALVSIIWWPLAWVISRASRVLRLAFVGSSRAPVRVDSAPDMGVTDKSGTDESVRPTDRTKRTGVLASCVPRPVWTLACLGGPLAGLCLYRAEVTVVGDVEIRADKKVEIRAEVDGLISSVLVSEGQRVAGTEMIACLASRETSAELAQIKAQVQRQQAELALLASGAKPEEIKLAEAAVETARTCYEHAGRRLEEAAKMQAERLRVAEAAVREAESVFQFASLQLARQQGLVKTRAITASELEQTQAEVRKGGAQLVAAKASQSLVRAEHLATLQEEVAVSSKRWQEEKERLSVLRAGPKPAQLRAVEAEIERLDARRQYLEDQMRRAEVTSPIEGVVTTPRLEELVNRNIQRGELIAEVQQLQTMRAELSVSELEIGDVQVGRPVILRVLAYPGHNFHGQVTRIAPAAASCEDKALSRSFIVTTEINNDSLLLKPGMSGKAKILAGRRLGMGQLVVRKLAQAVQVEFWSWWPEL